MGKSVYSGCMLSLSLFFKRNVNHTRDSAAFLRFKSAAAAAAPHSVREGDRSLLQGRAHGGLNLMKIN